MCECVCAHTHTHTHTLLLNEFFSQIRPKSISSRKYKKWKNLCTGTGGASGREWTISVLNTETTVQNHSRAIAVGPPPSLSNVSWSPL